VNDRRSGFTLMEIMLVLAIVAIIAAVAWPGVQRLYAGRRLTAAADRVRSAWCQARVEAMRSGRTYAFRYEPGGDRFRTERDTDADGAAYSAATTDQAARGNTSATSAGDASQTCEEQTLPEGVKFSADVACGRAASSAGAATRTAGNSANGWSAPILFYPDGTTADVQLVLMDQRSAAVRVLLRGMTGTVTVADIDSAVE
jgi:type II secretion system protein H